jgi:hypothetical protein
MTATAPPTPPFLYVESDIPEGITLVEWRHRRHEQDRRRSPIVAAVRRTLSLGR